MVSPEQVRKFALSLEDSEELPHFEKTSFRLKKKIFATMDVKNNRVCVLLSPIDQSAFCAFDNSVIYPVPNAWGKNGVTFIDLKKVKLPVLKDALTTAYQRLHHKKTKSKPK